MMRVVYTETTLLQYRVPFHEGVRRELSRHGIKYELILGQPSCDQLKKEDHATLGWEANVTNRYIRIGPLELVWQPVLQRIWNCDLAIVGQENRRLVNYVAQALKPFRPSRLAFCGHGRNFQATSEASLAERWKRFWATRCDWWFTYTEGTGRLVERYGFPRERITVFHNAIDTSQLRRWSDEIDDQELDSLRRQLNVATDKVAVYVGGLYGFKRIAFLIEAARLVRRHIPDFVLIVVGSGADRPLVEEAAATHSWIRYLGPRFGREKAAILRLGRVLVMPGLVGLAILDGAALGLPIVTTAYPYHSPEIGYLDPGENGLLVEDWQNSVAYADALTAVMRDDSLHARLASGARRMAETYTIERMIGCFCDGVLEALAVPKRH